MNPLIINNLHKSFGSNKVLEGVSFEVSKGSIFGFIGQNGSGKTTTMRIILGLLKADNGDITVFDKHVQYGQTPTNKMIGYLPDVPAFYGYMKPLEYLNLCGEISGMNKNNIKTKSEELIEMVGLKNNNRKIAGFSRGMKQRLGIAQALLASPKLLICDEPTSALDPAGRKEILDILKSVKGKTTVIFSTHILSDVERICDTIAVLHSGKIAITGSLSDIKSKYKSNVLNIEFAETTTAKCFFNLIETKFTKSELLNKNVSIKTSDILSVEEHVINLLSVNKLLPTKLEIVEPTLENLFLEVIK